MDDFPSKQVKSISTKASKSTRRCAVNSTETPPRTPSRLEGYHLGSSLFQFYGTYGPSHLEMVQFKIHSKSWWRKLQSTFAEKDAMAISLVKRLLDQVAIKLALDGLDGWKFIERSQVNPAIWARLDQLGGLQFVLRRVYPNHDWGPNPTESSLPQDQLNQQVKHILPR